MDCKSNKIICNKYQSPCGDLVLGAIGDRLCLCDWDIDRRREKIDIHLAKNFDATIHYGTSPLIDRAAMQLDEYFDSKRNEFDIPLAINDSEMRLAVWNSLLKITYGQTMTYSEIASMIGKPDAVRAVASAIGANPISIFIPCHRVIAKNGSLAGYAGGLPAKKHLLAIEHQLLKI